MAGAGLVSSRVVGRSHGDKRKQVVTSGMFNRTYSKLRKHQVSFSTRTSRAPGVLWVSAQSAHGSGQ